MNKKRRKILIWSFVGLFILAAGAALWAYSKIFAPNVQQQTEFFIPTGSSYDDVLSILSENDVLKDSLTFVYTAQLKKYGNTIYPGRYIAEKGMSNNDLVNMLRGGRQTPVKVTFNNIRDIESLAGKIGRQIEADSLQILSYLQNPDTLKNYGFSERTVLAMFIPDTYEFYWNTTADEFFKRMHKEFQNFWTKERLQKAERLGLTPVKVATLASIVQAEQSVHNDEKATVAGLYINRLRRGMPLESDPTLIYAIGDFDIKRVLNKDKEIDSPYNTYKNLGLPPGPINMPEKSSLNAVLNYKKHDYIFMCAKEDFSGYHYFSKSLRQHNVYRRKYQNALNRSKIYR